MGSNHSVPNKLKQIAPKQPVNSQSVGQSVKLSQGTHAYADRGLWMALCDLVAVMRQQAQRLTLRSAGRCLGLGLDPTVKVMGAAITGVMAVMAGCS